MRHLFWSDATLAKPPCTPFRFRMALSFHFARGSLTEVERCSLHVVEFAFPAGVERAVRDASYTPNPNPSPHPNPRPGPNPSPTSNQSPNPNP